MTAHRHRAAAIAALVLLSAPVCAQTGSATGDQSTERNEPRAGSTSNYDTTTVEEQARKRGGGSRQSDSAGQGGALDRSSGTGVGGSVGSSGRSGAAPDDSRERSGTVGRDPTKPSEPTAVRERGR